MLPDPLHPALVHFPIVLAVLAPLLAAAAFWAIRTGRLPQRSWWSVVLLQLALVGAIWIATESGEHEEDRVERVVAERPIHEHEENAERLFLIAGLVLPLAGAGLLAGRAGSAARGLTVVLSLAALGAAAATGHTGGQLVYTHGAASAYTQPGHAGDAPVARAHQDD